MKILFIATVTEHINAFHLPYLKWFKEQGWEVHVATKGAHGISYCDKKHDISIERSPFKIGNIKAYFELKKIIKTEKYDIIHGHTPMGGILTRLCGKKHRKNGAKIMYTAHGFHFYKGAPLINWLLYYPIEKWLSLFTDALITINHEDYELAKQKMGVKNIYYVPGVGVDTDNFATSGVSNEEKRAELNIPLDATVLISVGELNRNKNHQAIIKAIAELKNGKQQIDRRIEASLPNDDLYYIICGQGILNKELQALCKQLRVHDHVIFLGQRTDIADLLHMSDIFVFPSLREGLPVSLMEAMAAGLPCVASKIRGNVDLIEGGAGGFLCEGNSPGVYAYAIDAIVHSENFRNSMAENNKTAIQKFSLSVVMEKMKEIYLSQ